MLREWPRLARCEIGVTRFTRRPAILKTPFLYLTKKREGGLASFLVLGRHSEKSDAQFIRRARVFREDVGILPVGSSLDKSAFEFVPDALRKIPFDLPECVVGLRRIRLGNFIPPVQQEQEGFGLLHAREVGGRQTFGLERRHASNVLEYWPA